MPDLPNNFCVAAFLQLTTHPSGSFSPCPYLGGTAWQPQHDSIRQIWRSQDLEQLRQQFIDGVRPSLCHRCWHEEDNGKRSLRQRLYDPVTGTSDYAVINDGDLIPRLIKGMDDQLYLDGPRILTIKNGNVCNAKCRSCHPGDSSRWIEDAVKLQSYLGRVDYRIDQTEKNWSDHQLDEIFDLCQTLDRLELFGGEPLYNKKVLALLARIVESGHSSHIDLYINTNGSVDLLTQVPDVAGFRQVEIGVSIDAVGDRFEYLRHGLRYQQVIDNIERWKRHFRHHGVRHSIDSISTVSVFNILHLPELKRAVMEVLPQSPFWNLLIDPGYLFIKNMPDKLKQAAIDLLAHDAEFNDLISVMQQPADTQQWQKFLEITTTLDHIRHEDFARTFPELASLIN